jgi:hypothetical protein
MFEITLAEDVGDMDSTGIKVLYDGPLGKLSVPLTEEASCKLGKGTKWCTAAVDGKNMFERYNKDGPLYIWVDNNWNKGVLKSLDNKSKKFQFHFQSNQYMDELDNELGYDVLHYFRMEHPVTKKLFENYIKSLTNPRDIVEYVRYMDPDNEDLYIDTYVMGSDLVQLEYIRVDRLDSDSDREAYSQMSYVLLDDLIDRLDGNTDVAVYAGLYDDHSKEIEYAIEKYIIPDLNKASQFAILRGEPWESIGKPGVDLAILTNPEYIMNYILGVKNLKRIKPIKTDNLIIKAVINRDKDVNIVDLYKLDKKAAGYYAINVIRSRVKYIEQGSFGSDLLDEQYYKLFTKKDKPDNVHKLDKEHANLIREGDLELLSRDDIPQWERGDMFEFYREYVRLYSRSEVIERYLVNVYRTIVPKLTSEKMFTNMSYYIFKCRLCYSLSYIDPNIELNAFDTIGDRSKFLRYYIDILVTPNIRNIMSIRNMLAYLMINGQEGNMDYLLRVLSSSNADIKLEDFKFLTYESAKYLYDNADSVYVKILAYTLMNNTGSRELEDEYMKNKGPYIRSNIYYQFYWNKFLCNRKMPIFEKVSSHKYAYITYWDNYRGEIELLESLYILPVGYLKTRVR